MPQWILLLLIIAGALFALKLLYLITTVWALPVTKGALFVPTPSKMIQTFLDAVPMNSQELFVDLGCGHGRVLRAVRKRYNVRALGFEVNLLAYFTARLMSFGIKGIQIRWGDFWAKDLGGANVVFCYLFPDVMGRLAKRLEDVLHPGARVVSCNFPLPGWNPIKVMHADSTRHDDPIYLYHLPDSCRLLE
jgi:trans-aconitate methyltransferase